MTNEKSEVQSFIEDAIAGEWKHPLGGDYRVKHIGEKAAWFECGGKHDEALWLSEILLDPLAWQAVGKTRGWTINIEDIDDERPFWWSKAADFWGCVMNGKTVEEALAALR